MLCYIGILYQNLLDLNRPKNVFLELQKDTRTTVGSKIQPYRLWYYSSEVNYSIGKTLLTVAL